MPDSVGATNHRPPGVRYWLRTNDATYRIPCSGPVNVVAQADGQLSKAVKPKFSNERCGVVDRDR
jgi:hypothetical protein